MHAILLALLFGPPAMADLIPPPKSVRRPEAPGCDLAAGCRITAGPGVDARPGGYLVEGLTARGIRTGTTGPAIVLGIEGGTATGAEAQRYRLTVGRDGIVIRAPAAAGLLYGAVTLLQWIDAAGSGTAVPPVAIEDAPDLELRGLTIDFRYAGLSETRIRRAIDRAAALKANILVWWLQDRFAWTSHPELAGPGALSATTWGALVAHADARFIQMVPYVDAYGHGERYLEHPQWSGLSRGEHGFWGGDDLQYCASHPRSWTLFDDLTREATAVFANSTWLHVGMDEVGAQDSHLCGNCRNEIRAIAHRTGEDAPYPRARNRFVAQRLAGAAARAAKLGRRVMCWDDSATTVGTLAFGPGGIEAVPDGVTPMVWHYDADPVWLRQALARPAARRFPTIVATSSNDPDNILRDLAATRDYPHVIGAVATIWEGDVRRFEARWPGFALALAMGWNRSATGGVWDEEEARGPAGWAPLADPEAWIPDNPDSPDAARADASPRVIRLACPFPALKDWRLVWDADTRLDLSGDTAVGLRLRADDPGAVGSVVVYFRSGDGWFRMPDLHPGSAWTPASWPHADAKVEGHPAGWKQVNGVRISILPAEGPRHPAAVELAVLPD